MAAPGGSRNSKPEAGRLDEATLKKEDANKKKSRKTPGAGDEVAKTVSKPAGGGAQKVLRKQQTTLDVANADKALTMIKVVPDGVQEPEEEAAGQAEPKRTPPVAKADGPKAAPSKPAKQENADERFQAADRRCIVRCFQRLEEAEAALSGARSALSELGLRELAAALGGGGGKAGKLKHMQTATVLNLDGAVEEVLDACGPAGDGLDGEDLEQAIAHASKVRMHLKPNLPGGDHTVDQIVVTSIQQTLEDHSAQTDATPKKGRPLLMGAATMLLPTDASQVDQSAVYTRADINWMPVREGGAKVPILHPESHIRVTWMMATFALIVYEIAAIPVFLGFEIDADGGWLVWASMINSFFLLDILMNFFTGHLNGQGKVILKPDIIASHYIRTWFIPDCIASIPWEWLPANNQSVSITKLIRSVRILRLLRLIRVMKLGSLLTRLETFFESSHHYIFAFGALRIAGESFVLCHWCACVWYRIGSTYIDEENGGQPISWLKFYEQNYPFIDENKLIEKYIYSLYYCLTTLVTVGYGDISPKNFQEVLFAICLLVLSSVCFANLMGSLTVMLSTLNKHKQMVIEKKVELSRYMQFRQVPWKLMMSIRQHFLFIWDLHAGHDHYEREFKRHLSPILREELCHHIYGAKIRAAPFLAWMRDYPICTRYLAERVYSQFLTENDKVFRMHEPNEKVYMLLDGRVSVSRIEYLNEQDTKPYYADEDGEASKKLRVVVADIMKEIHKDTERRKKVKARQKMRQRLHEGLGLGHGADKSKDKTGTQKAEAQMETVLAMAVWELRVIDIRRNIAARSVQRCYREKVKARHKNEKLGMTMEHAKSVKADKDKSWLKRDRDQKRMLVAPAYFGESCLWQRLEDWGIFEPPQYLYTLVCHTRSEFAYIHRSSIKEMLDRFSPWLPERLELFRTVVQEKLAEKARHGQFAELLDDWEKPS